MKLDWSTATELNNRGFEIERSVDDKDFITRGFVEGAGTSTEMHEYSFTEDALNGNIYYRLKQIDYDGNYNYSKSIEIKSVYVSNFELSQNYPNPFNPVTSIQYSVSSRQFVTLKVYDALGNEIMTLVNEEKPAGNYEVEFNGTGFSSGVYFYKLSAGSFVETKKMILMK